MTERPYTDEDLRAEAARQLSAHGPGLSPEQVYAAILDTRIGSTDTDGPTWSEALDVPELAVPADAIHSLIGGAADMSTWAVNLGADGLEPDDHYLQLGVDPGDGDRPRVRIHFAFHPDMDDDARDGFVFALSRRLLQDLADTDA